MGGSDPGEPGASGCSWWFIIGATIAVAVPIPVAIGGGVVADSASFAFPLLLGALAVAVAILVAVAWIGADGGGRHQAEDQGHGGEESKASHGGVLLVG
jgi:hypothetical protein